MELEMRDQFHMIFFALKNEYKEFSALSGKKEQRKKNDMIRSAMTMTGMIGSLRTLNNFLDDDDFSSKITQSDAMIRLRVMPELNAIYGVS